MFYREMSQSHNTHLNNELLLKNAPSIFAEQPFHDVSEKYGFIPTINVIDGLRDNGWFPVDATQKNVRLVEKENFTKHLVRFRRLNDDIQVGDSVVELVLTNSHDRTSGFILHAGIFRMACANGIVVADSTFQKVSVRHSQHSADRVIEGSYTIIDEVPKITSEIESMQNIELTRNEQMIFARTALDYMTPEPKKDAPQVLTADNSIIEQMLRPKRVADVGSDLWGTYNVIQEKCLRGGLRITKRNAKGQYRRTTTREVKSIDRSIKLNKALWDMATQMRSLKKEVA